MCSWNTLFTSAHGPDLCEAAPWAAKLGLDPSPSPKLPSLHGCKLLHLAPVSSPPLTSFFVSLPWTHQTVQICSTHFQSTISTCQEVITERNGQRLHAAILGLAEPTTHFGCCWVPRNTRMFAALRLCQETSRHVSDSSGEMWDASIAAQDASYA